ncbi:MAG: helix-turn-helix domain-containing protein [Rhodospirillales bacterium]
MHDIHEGEFRLLLSINDTCLALGIGRNRVYDLIRDSLLDTRRIGGRRLVTVESVKRLAETGA